MSKEIAKPGSLICAACGKKIGMFSKMTALECSACGHICHSECLRTVKNIRESKNSTSTAQTIWICSKCLPAYSEKNIEGKSCSVCGSNLNDATTTAHCENCAEIGHESCLRSMGIKISGRIHLIYPYLHSRNNYKCLCQECYGQLDDECNKVQEADDPLLIRGDRLRGFRVIKEISLIETGIHHNEKEVKSQLKKYCLQLGGNAIFNYWYDVNRDKREAGRSDNDNPFYETVMEFKGTGKAVLIEPIKNFRQYPENHYKSDDKESKDRFRVCFYNDGNYWKVGKLGSELTIKELKGMKLIHYMLDKPSNYVTCSSLYNLLIKNLPEDDSVDKDTMNTGWVVVKGKIDAKTIKEYQNTIDYLTTKIENEHDPDKRIEYKEKQAKLRETLDEYNNTKNRGGDPNRLIVRKLVQTAIRNIIEAESEIDVKFSVGQHFENYIDTGSSVGYVPPEMETVEWILFKNEL